MRCTPLLFLYIIGATNAFVAKQQNNVATTDENLSLLFREVVVKEFGLNLPTGNLKRSFSYILNQLIELQPEQAGPRAEILLRQYPENTTTILNKVLACYLKSVSTVSGLSNKRQLATNASTLLNEWPHKDLVSYNTLLSIFGKAVMCQQARSTFDSLETPNLISYSVLLHAYAAAGRAREARQLFDTMLVRGPAPNIHCYNNVLNAYAKSSNPFAAQEFLSSWVRNKTARVKPSVRSYNIVLHALPWHKAEKFFWYMPQRDLISYTTMIATCCKARGNVDASLITIQKLIRAASESDRLLVTPSFFTNVLYSLGMMDGLAVADFAEQLVMELMPSLQIASDIDVYNALLHCWSQQSQFRGERALQLLEFIESDSNVQPTIKTYTNALNAWKGRGDFLIPAAQDLMQRLETTGPAPTVATYTAMIQIYAKSNVPRKASSAWEIFKRMPTRNIVAYNVVLNACEYTDTVKNDQSIVEEALKVACVVFDEIRHCSTSCPNHVTYGSFLGVLANLMPTEASRQETVALVFKRCAAEGQVNKFVLKKLKEAASSDLYKELLQGNGEDRLPVAWTVNVREGKARKEY